MNGKTYANPIEIADKFNEYFVNVGPTLAKNVNNNNSHFTQFMTKHNESSIFLSPVTDAEVSTILTSLKNTSPGFDDLNIKVIKNVTNELSHPLTYICNISFQTGIIPHELKLAKVIPVYK